MSPETDQIEQLNQVKQLLREIDAAYRAVYKHYSRRPDSHQTEGTLATGTTVVTVHDYEPSLYERLVAEYEDSERVSAAFRTARKSVGTVLNELGRELDDIFGTYHAAQSDTVDPQHVISRLQAYKAHLVFRWKLASDLEQHLVADSDTWSLEGPEYVLDDGLARDAEKLLQEKEQAVRIKDGQDVGPERDVLLHMRPLRSPNQDRSSTN